MQIVNNSHKNYVEDGSLISCEIVELIIRYRGSGSKVFVNCNNKKYSFVSNRLQINSYKEKDRLLLFYDKKFDMVFTELNIEMNRRFIKLTLFSSLVYALFIILSVFYSFFLTFRAHR